MRAYYRDFGMVPPQEPEYSPHLQLEVADQLPSGSDMFASQGIVGNRYALPSFSWREASALEQRQTEASVVSVGGIGPLGTSRQEMAVGLREVWADKANQKREIPFLDRFFAKVEPRGDCLVWTGATDIRGRGLFRMGKKLQGAHRVAFTLYFGEEPPVSLVQSCGNVACVKREHLIEQEAAA